MLWEQNHFIKQQTVYCHQLKYNSKTLSQIVLKNKF